MYYTLQVAHAHYSRFHQAPVVAARVGYDDRSGDPPIAMAPTPNSVNFRYARHQVLKILITLP